MGAGLIPVIECATPTRSQLGEGVAWDVEDARLCWVDIAGALIHRFDPSGGRNESFDFGEPVGCVARHSSGDLVVAAKSGFWAFNPDTGMREFLSDPELHLPGNRFNDGTTDKQGRYWAGTITHGGQPEPSGGLCRLDIDLRATLWRGGIHTTNGLECSPDGSRMYFSDSNPSVRIIWVANFDADMGAPDVPLPFFNTRVAAGRPDGGNVDADGCYCHAGISSCQLHRITPAGRLDRTNDFPVERPTKPMFGGAGPNTPISPRFGKGWITGARSRGREASSSFPGWV